MKFPHLKIIKSLSGENVNPILRQIFVASGPLFLTVSVGMTSGYSAILLPQLQDGNLTSVKVTKEESSWIASIAALSMAFGCILSAFLMENFGRKTCHLICTVPCLIGWLLLATAPNLTSILTGRWLTGMCAGLVGPVTGIYIAETSSPRFRGFLLAAISLAVSLGLLVVHLLGTFYHWRTCAYVSAIFPVTAAILLLLSPESPAWLAKIGNTVKAQRNFRWCRGTCDQANKELSEMMERQKNDSNSPTFRVKLATLTKREFIKPLLIIVVFIVANQWVGVNALTFYGVSIMQETVGEGMDEYVAMLAIDSIRLVMSAVACVLLRRHGRRPLALISGVGTFLSLGALASYTFLVRTNPTIQLAVIPMTALVTYIASVSVGFVPLPWAMMGEVFPLANRNVGTSLTSLAAFTAFFSVVKTTPAMFDSLRPEGTFAIYGSVALIGTIFVYFFLPETKDKPLHEIEDYFRK